MTEQPALFNTQPNPTQPARTCIMCKTKQAAWMPRKKQWSNYCGSNACTNTQRTCKACNQIYTYGDPGSGTKYCSLKCKQHGYAQGQTSRPTNTCRICKGPTYGVACRHCQKEHPWANSLIRHSAPQPIWDHMIKIGQCMNPACRTDITGVVQGAGGSWRAACCVDHDHTCCRNKISCGNCIRGVLCGKCNSALGLLNDDTRKVAGLAQYAQGGNHAAR